MLAEPCAGDKTTIQVGCCHLKCEFGEYLSVLFDVKIMVRSQAGGHGEQSSYV